MTIQHLLHECAALDTDTCATVTICGPNGPVATYGFHALSEEQVANGVTIRVMALTDRPCGDAGAMSPFSAQVKCAEGFYLLTYCREDSGFTTVQRVHAHTKTDS